MKKSKTKKTIWLLSACAVPVLALAVGFWAYCHPTHWRFNDRAILGHEEEEIVARYGAFASVHRSETGEIACGTYIIRDNTPELVMSYDDSLWYEIYFEDGVAVRVRLQKGRYGG